jgi:CRP/FNR family transcriptional regulator, cyclic AMP receptor protein
MTQPVISVLRRVQFLEDASDEFLDRLAPRAQIVTVPAGRLVFRQGDVANSFYLLLEGSVSLEICAPAIGCKRILTVEPGELLGLSSALAQPRMTATARALTDILAIGLDGPGCLAICESEPRFGYELMKRTALALAKRLNATRLQLLNVYGDQMPTVADERAVR